ncbi:MAG: hypothetical protein K2O10_04755, partial [Muribaculaceae bacterium]|nr:hypothetical protein [Muribaculaceae bacterium]
MMTQTIESGTLHCHCCTQANTGIIAYILYPTDLLSGWIAPAAEKYNVSIVVVTGMDWQNVFSPWPAAGVPKGSADFKGESPEFLKRLQCQLIPQVESAIGVRADVERTLVGVSMSGMFALWQWMLCDTFKNIASLSGSFWYDGFTDWIKKRQIPQKNGKAFFLLGDQESHSKVKAFDSVGQNTAEIISLLK